MTKNSEKIYFFSLRFRGFRLSKNFYCSSEIKFAVLLSEFESSGGFSSAETEFCVSGSAFLGSGAGGFGNGGTFDKSAVVSKVLGSS